MAQPKIILYKNIDFATLHFEKFGIRLPKDYNDLSFSYSEYRDKYSDYDSIMSKDEFEKIDAIIIHNINEKIFEYIFKNKAELACASKEFGFVRAYAPRCFVDDCNRHC